MWNLIKAGTTIGLIALSGLSHAQSHPTCSSAVVDQDGDGWGYEHGRSCIMSSSHPTCSSNAIVDGNWGFENGRSCRVATSSGSTPSCTSAAVNNGDGWGWENNRSCRYEASAQTPAPAGMELVWSENFNGTTIDPTKWDVFTGNYGTPKRVQIYSDAPENVRVENGALILKAVSYTHLTLPTTPYV